MSRRSIKKAQKHKRPGTWKLIDDKSGFVIYSYEMVVDHKGRVTSADNYDPPSIKELEGLTKMIPESPLPFGRPEQTDEFIEPSDND